MARRIHRALFALLLVTCTAALGAEKEMQGGLAKEAPLPSSLPLRRDAAEASPHMGWWPSLVLLTLAGAGGAWTLRRRARRGTTTAARKGEDRHAVRVSSQALTAHASVHVVRWNGEELLVGCTAQQLQLLARRNAPDAPPEERP
jgi:flagellar biogenesis protein FliO